jgi:hypothetical protein
MFPSLFLIRCCSYVHLKDDKGMAPLHYAVKSPEGVQFLVDQGATVDRFDSKDHTPLWLAVKKESEESARVLIKAGADIEAVDKRGRKVCTVERVRDFLRWITPRSDPVNGAKVVDMARGDLTKQMLIKMAAERDVQQDLQHKANMAEAVQKFNAKPATVRSPPPLQNKLGVRSHIDDVSAQRRSTGSWSARSYRGRPKRSRDSFSPP